MSSSDPETAAILASDMTTSAKIRALNAAGYLRADIARMLGKRYQHVRNVLEDDKGRVAGPVQTADEGQPEGMAEAPRNFERSVEARTGGFYRFVLGKDGALEMPAELLERLGVDMRNRVVMGHLVGDTLELVSAATSMRRVQEMAKRYHVPGVSLVDELLAERREENAREIADD